MGVDVSTQNERERMAVRPWEAITGSEEFQAIADNALEGLGPILHPGKRSPSLRSSKSSLRRPY